MASAIAKTMATALALGLLSAGCLTDPEPAAVNACCIQGIHCSVDTTGLDVGADELCTCTDEFGSVFNGLTCVR